MKRFLALLLFAFTTLSLASCSMSNVNSATGDNSDAHSESFLNNGTGAGANADTDGGSETSDGFGEPTARLCDTSEPLQNRGSRVRVLPPLPRKKPNAIALGFFQRNLPFRQVK